MAGIKPVARTHFDLYPVPAEDVLHIDAEQQPLQLALLNMDGRMIMQRSPVPARTTLDLSALAPGSYLLQLQWPGGIRAARLVVKH